MSRATLNTVTVRAGAVVYIDGEAHEAGATLKVSAAAESALADVLVSPEGDTTST